MNNASITKTVSKANLLSTQYSLGFARLHALPKRVRASFNAASLANGQKTNEAHSSQKSFLESMTDDEFVNWLKLA